MGLSLTQRWTDVCLISPISCGGDILTPAQLWAQIVNRFSMAKHYHVFSAAEACKLAGGWDWHFFWLRLEFFWLRTILVVRRQVFESAWDGWGTRGRATVDVIISAFSTTADICLAPLLPQPPPPPHPPSSASIIPLLSFPRLLLCNELSLFTS